jgi:RNase P/RNase MRP subunit p29
VAKEEKDTYEHENQLVAKGIRTFETKTDINVKGERLTSKRAKKLKTTRIILLCPQIA